MIAVITDVYYKMALSIIRDLGEQGIKIVACQSEIIKEKKADTMPVGFFSKYVVEQKWLANYTTQEEAYMDGLYETCKKASEASGEKCVLIPVGARTLHLLTDDKYKDKFAEVGMMIPTREQLDLFNGKKEVAELAAKLGVPVPVEYKLTDENLEEMVATIPLPCVVKPNCGEKLNLKAEERYYIAKDRQGLKEKVLHFYRLEKQYPVVQEFVAGAGFGLSVLAHKGKIIDFVGHQRVREYPYTGGPSTCCIYQEDPVLVDYAKKMVAEASYSGIAMFEYKQAADGTYRLLEINPRVWGTYPLTRAARTQFTYNWFALAYNTVNEKHIPLHQDAARKRNTKMRYFFADVRATFGYMKSPQRQAGTQGLLDLVNPSVRDGVIEIGDLKASLKYIESMFRG